MCASVTPMARVQIQLGEVKLLLCFIFIYNFHFCFFIFSSISLFKSKKYGKLSLKMVQNKNASVWNWTQKVSVTAHHLYHRANDDLCQTYPLIYHKAIRYFIGDLFKANSIRWFLFINLAVYGICMSATSNQNDNNKGLWVRYVSLCCV